MKTRQLMSINDANEGQNRVSRTTMNSIKKESLHRFNKQKNS